MGPWTLKEIRKKSTQLWAQGSSFSVSCGEGGGGYRVYIGFRGSGLGSRVYRVYSSLAAVRWRLPKAGAKLPHKYCGGLNNERYIILYL